MITFLERVEVGSGGSASIEFQNINNEGLHLLLVMSLRTDVVSPYGVAAVRLNSDATSSNYRYADIRHSGTGSVNSSGTTSLNYFYVNGQTSTADTFSNTEYLIYNYNSAEHKRYSLDSVMEYAANNCQNQLTAGSYTTSSSITSIEIISSSANFEEFSSATLYSIS